MLASRKELLEYDLQQREAATKSSRSSSSNQPTITASQYRALSVLGCGHTSSTKCYGCASAVTGHCITLLRALATNPALRQILVLQGLIRELFEYNLRRGTAAMRDEVRQLICLLTRWVSPHCVVKSINMLVFMNKILTFVFKYNLLRWTPFSLCIYTSHTFYFRDHPEATQQMNDLIIAKVSAALKGHWANPDLVCQFFKLVFSLLILMQSLTFCLQLFKFCGRFLILV